MTGSSVTPRKALSKITSNRLQKELMEFQVNPPAGFKHKAAANNLQRWVIEMNGAPETLFANETYQLQVDFPDRYPMEAPQVIFLHPAPLHPNIYSNGHIRLDILYDQWSPATTLNSICSSILFMLSSSTVKERPEDNDGYVSNCKNGRSTKRARLCLDDMDVGSPVPVEGSSGNSVGSDPPPYWMCLPLLTKSMILKSLAGVDLARMGCVCRETLFLSSDNDLWKKKMVEEFGGTGVESGVVNWKQRFAWTWAGRKRRN